MRISLFYPISYALIAGMLLYALKPGLERMQAWQRVVAAAPTQGLVFEGELLGALIATERASVVFDGPAGERFAILDSTGVVTDQDVFGVHYFVPADAVRALGGFEVEAGFEVRADSTAGARAWFARAIIPGATDTGWVELPVEAEWSSEGIRFVVPRDGQQAMDIMIWSDALGDSRQLDLRRITIDPLGAAQ